MPIEHMDMKHPKIIVAGIGPGNESDITPAVISALQESDVVVGYKYYFQFVTPYLHPSTACIDTGMKRERARAEQAFELAEQGKTVCVISSGDAGIYGMTPLVYEMKRERNSDVEIVSLPGISAFQKAASLLGAPVGHDFCVISLSDLMTPWERIERRIIAAAAADFVTAVYNPKSEGRYWQLYRLKELFLQEGRSPETPVGYVRQAGRPEQAVHITTLGDFNPEEVDMFTVVLIGNSQSYEWNGAFITPRGYYRDTNTEATGIGQDIMIRSFRTIEKELKNKHIPLDHKWALLHAIHTTADFEMEYLLHTDEGAVASFVSSHRERRNQDHCHRRHDGSQRYPQRSFAAAGRRGEMLPWRPAYGDDGCRERHYPYPGRHPPGCGGASRCILCIRQCTYGTYGTLRPDT